MLPRRSLTSFNFNVVFLQQDYVLHATSSFQWGFKTGGYRWLKPYGIKFEYWKELRVL